MSFDFFDDTPEDSIGTPEGDDQKPEASVEESTADDTDEEGVQEEPTDADSDDEEPEDDEESEYIDLDGEEITLDQIREFKKGYLREQDYTKKNQALAEERKGLSEKVSSIDSALASLSSIEDEVKGLLVADLDEIDMKSLREHDYPEYLRVKEEREEKTKLFDALKAKAEEAAKTANSERSKELYSIMGWDDKSKYEQDVSSFNDVAKEFAFTAEDTATLKSPKVMQALFELAKLKKTAKAEPPKGKAKKVAISKRSKSSAPPRAASKDERRTSTSFFD